MRFVIRNRGDLARLSTTVAEKLDGSPLTVTVRKFHRPRTLDQNSKFHAIIGELADHTGHSTSEMKMIVKRAFLRQHVVKVGGVEVEVPISTMSLTVQEGSDFIERLHGLAAEIGCQLQDG